ncbi:hypothetical protein C461_03332 [Halorubrum aidingense JCM 13560]|uniref:DUF4897 domain-containing protein n=1 Tax=Halorubrum aidingense JCM 13560 TaxID=1230454 RepID=M0PGC7_9EURY|nr:hypothetical protein [Halorubrum aidingense]EMA68629.1 hypothetical protein C461_03332 [Halorubrum aidingense JCM 13560]
MQRTVFVFVVTVALIAAGVGAAATGASASGPAGVPDGGFEQMDVDPDDVLIEVSVEPDGDAVWEMQYRVRLATEDEEQAFTELRTDVENDPEAYTDRFRQRMVSTADVAENATGREMEISNTTITAERRELPQSYGVLTYRFRWAGFAAVDDDRLVVGDAIDGLFLDEASSLILSWPDGYELADVSPSPTETRERAVVWDGPVEFTDGQPRVTVGPEGVGVGSVLLGAVGLLVVAGAAIVYRRRRRAGTASGATGEETAGATEAGATGATAAGTATGAADDSSAAGGDADAESKSDTAGDPDAADGSDSSAAPTDGAGESDAADESPTAPVDDELLSNEEQVLRLIEANGGRMKQKRVADELDWTAAKTSQVVTGLRDDDELDGFRLGRENVLSLPGYDAKADETTDDDE